MSLIVTSKYVGTWGVTHLAPQIAPMLKRWCIRHSSDEPMGGVSLTGAADFYRTRSIHRFFEFFLRVLFCLAFLLHPWDLEMFT